MVDPKLSQMSAKKTSLELDPLRQKLKEELESSLLLEEEDRQYWLTNLPDLPLYTVENLLEHIVPKNQQMNEYIELALAQDKNQEYLTALKAQTTKIIQQALHIEEKTESSSEEQNEEQLLQQLDDM